MNSKRNSILDMQLYRSDYSPCPYVAGRTEQQIFAVLAPPELNRWADRLNRMGFRRSMNSIYMPLCPGCQSCRSVRVLAQDYVLSRSMRRVLRVNEDLEFRVGPTSAEAESFALFQRYLQSRHEGSDMNEVDEQQFRQLVEIVPEGAFQLSAYLEGRLLGAMMVDAFGDGYSAVYSFFEPRAHKRSLGVMLVLELLRRAKAAGLGYVYLGYYVAEVQNMAYKARFRPLEVFDWEQMGWRDFAANTG